MSEPILNEIFMRFVAGRSTPVQVLDELVAVLHSTAEPDPQLIGQVGLGPLESLLLQHEEELWPSLERLARNDERFRRALAAVWAYDSPAFDRREVLLKELGEFQDVTVTFVVQREDFGQPPLVSHRAVNIEGEIPGGQLPRILREIADRLEVVHKVKRVDTQTLLALDDSSMRRRRRRSLGPDWVHGYILGDGAHLISPVNAPSDELNETDELSCRVAVAMTDGTQRAVLMGVLRSEFDRLPDTLSDAEQTDSRTAMEGLPALGPWISDRMPPSRFKRR